TLVSVATDSEATVSAVSLLWKHAPYPLRTVADYRAALVRALSGGMLNNRLSELAQRPDAPFAYAYATDQSLVRARDAFVLAGPAKSGRITQTLASLLEEAARVDRHGFTATELAREGAELLRGYEQAYAERAKTGSAAYASEYERAFLDDQRTPGIAYEYALARRVVPTITLAEVHAVVRGQVTDSNRVLLVTAPASDSAAVPAEAELRAVLDSSRTVAVAAYDDRVSTAPLVEHPPVAGRVVRSTPIPAVGAVEWRLANGVRVFVKPTAFKDDEVVLQGWSPGGHSLAPDSLFIPASTADEVIAQGGLGALDLVQLRKSLAGTAAGASVAIGGMEETASGVASPKDVELMLQLVYLSFTAPRADSSAFAAFRSRVRAFLENRSLEPQQIFADTVQVTLAQHHPRARPISLGWLDSLSLDRSLRFYRERFANAGDFTFALVGALDTAAVRPLVERWLGGLPAIDREEQGRDVGLRPPAGVVRRTVYAGREPRANTQLVFTGPFDYDRETRLRLAALADVLEIRLRDVLREALGGTYGVRVGQSSAREPRAEYSIGIAFGSAPERAEELTRAVFAQIDSLRRAGPTDDELARVQEIRRRALQTSLERNGWWAGQLLAYDRQGWDLAMIPGQRALVDALTAASLRDAARQWLDPARHVQVTLLPERSRPIANGGAARPGPM
ncbi:MAG TPA: insulinase family protein, partial [Gemmatimonadaceae bacterium]|nr:insulinase family protein [Gemmatimonadaceae bacterium]